MKHFFLTLLMAASLGVCHASIDIQEAKGWFESGFVTWQTAEGLSYDVFCRPEGGKYTKLDQELVRNYGSYGRADMLGLSAGRYQLKVVASSGEEAETPVISVTAYDRNGFAHYDRTEGIGAYNNDGTLKANARVLYVNANNAKTVKCMVMGDKDVEYTGLQSILAAFEKGKETRPLDIRIVGTIKKDDLDRIGSSAEGLQVKGKNGTTPMNITIEGVGNDATVHGFGFLIRNACSVELRNFAVMICMDDCISLDTDNKHCWVHNMDFFYGGTGSDADQAKGDGTVDIKGKSSHITVSYNHFYDSGKCSLGGMKSETTDCWMTYHHNWFDHSDSRHPRIRTAFYHIYNNYFDGNSKYGVGCTMGGSAFVESNYFRNCKYPMLISKQGTDAEGDGTFSGEDGGVIKQLNNVIRNPRQVLNYKDGQTDGKWDAVTSNSREEEITATAFAGGTGYNNAATAQAILAVPVSVIEPADNVPATVRGWLGAGRIGHGDFQWLFNNAIQDANDKLITELKQALLNYKSTLVGYFDGTAINNGGAAAPTVGGDGIGISQEQNDSYVPEWAVGGSNNNGGDVDEEDYIATESDFYWVGDNNIANTRQLISDGIITLGNPTYETDKTSSFAENYAGNDTYKSEHTGSLQMAQASAGGTYNGGSCTFYCAKGVTTFKISTLRTGSTYYRIEKSTDGTSFTKAAEVSKGASGILEKDFSANVRNTESTVPVWIRVVNGSTGGLNIFGVCIRNLDEDANGFDTMMSDNSRNSSNVLYDLQGRRVMQPEKGHIYICNGKKIRF